MELLQLKYFCMLAKNQHLTETAKELMISPPSLSLTIKKLEQEVGVSLFDRVGRDIRLNSSGEIFYHYIERGLIFIEEGIYKAQKYHGGGQKPNYDLLWESAFVAGTG